MIIRKPYAFLIKNFRLIHGLLLMLLIYSTIKLFSIYSFFSGYVQNHTYTVDPNLASNYVGLLIFFVLILIIAISMLIYFILSIKKKEDKIYLYISLYHIVLFVFYIYMNIVFTTLQTNFMDVESVRILRDISILVCIPQLIFLAIIFFRTLGFNLKQFDFKKDLEELQIDKEDYEEVEVTLGNNNYKILRYIRKMFRLSKYFVFENKMFVVFCLSVTALVCSLSFFIKYETIESGYGENQTIVANALNYKVNQTYITITDMRNELIDKNLYYILVDVSVENNTKIDKKLTRDTFRLYVNGENREPVYSLGNKFIDIEKSFNEMKLVSGYDSKFIVVFEVTKEEVASDYMFRIKNMDTYTPDVDEYKSIVVKPKNLNKNTNVENLNLPADIKFKDTVLKETSLIIGEYEIGEKFKEKYRYCILEECNDATYVVIPQRSSRGDQVALKLKTTLSMDESLYINKFIKSSSDLLDYYGSLKYRVHGLYKHADLEVIKAEPLKDKYSYFQVPADILEADKIELIILIRGKKYTINLK